MNLPIDVTSLITAALDIQKAQSTNVAVNLLIDETAPAELQVFVRSGFTSESLNARVLVSYFPMQKPDYEVACDFTVIAAGTNESVAEVAATFEQAGMPVLVIAQNAEAVCTVAQQAGYPLASENVIGVGAESIEEGLGGELALRIGTWIIDAIDQEKRLAFSIAYPFARRPLANQAIRATSLENVGVGIVAIVPGADMPIMTANQAKMLLQIAAAYGHPLSAERAKELGAVLLNGFFFRSISRGLVGLVPVGGWAIKGAMGYVGTQAIGRAAVEYFEAGGNAAGLASVTSKAINTATQTVEAIQENPSFAVASAKVGPVVRNAVGSALDAVAPVLKNAAGVAASSLKPGARKKRAKAAKKVAQ